MTKECKELIESRLEETLYSIKRMCHLFMAAARADGKSEDDYALEIQDSIYKGLNFMYKAMVMLDNYETKE